MSVFLNIYHNSPLYLFWPKVIIRNADIQKEKENHRYFANYMRKMKRQILRKEKTQSHEPTAHMCHGGRVATFPGVFFLPRCVFLPFLTNMKGDCIMSGVYHAKGKDTPDRFPNMQTLISAEESADVSQNDTKNADHILSICLESQRLEENSTINVHRSGETEDLRQLIPQKRPWGSYTVIEQGEGYKIKRMTVLPGKRLSLQMHYHRNEYWLVVEGTARVTVGEGVFLLPAHQSTYIPVKTKHRLENPGESTLEVLEIQNGMCVAEQDIVRFEDDYNRN